MQTFLSALTTVLGWFKAGTEAVLGGVTFLIDLFVDLITPPAATPPVGVIPASFDADFDVDTDADAVEVELAGVDLG